MVDFFSQFGRIRTPEDFQRAREEFELNKQFKRGQLDVQKAQIAKAQKEAANPLSGAPATLQINAAIQKALDAGDYDTANRIAWLQRSQAYGIDTFGSQGNTPETFKPFTPKTTSAQEPAQQPERPMGQGIVPSYDKPEYVPTGQSILGGSSSITQQLANKAAIESGAKKRAELQQQMDLSPEIKRREAEQAAIGARQGAIQTELGERASVMPQLMETVNQLSDLGKIATYTYGGQAADFLRRQVGAEPSEGAVARSDYISLVDNQILPLLRQTFGAQFTAQEGESLKNTLGDPDKSPKEKDAVLRSFINQKMMTINSLEREAGLPVTDWGKYKQQLGSFYQKPAGARGEMKSMEIRSKLERQGFSKEQINEYMKAKGL